MTEDEAKTKWCPMARSRLFGTDGVGNRPFTSPDNSKVDCNCIASACMAWRAVTRTEVYRKDGSRVEVGQTYLHGSVTTHKVVVGGYCGLAGKP